MRYDCLIIDTFNLAYRVFDHRKEMPSSVAKKQVYKKAIANFIQTVDNLIKDYLHSDGEIYLLFDNPTSRIDLQSAFYFADRKLAYAKYKQDRAKEPKEFYNSINLLRYFYLVNSPKFHTLQLNRLEADDLVAPLLNTVCKDKTCLLVSNDLDWARYLSDSVDWMPHATPESHRELADRMGFPISEASIVAHKVLFGDPADNIPGIVPPRFQEDFLPLGREIKDATDLPFLCIKESYLEKYPFLSYVQDNVRQCRINLQLVNSIPVADKHILRVITSGRDSLVCKNAVLEAIGLLEKNDKFVFGNVKRPRV